MAYPAGVTLQTVNVGEVLDWQGAPATSVSAIVTPVVGGSPSHIVHAASGAAMAPSSFTTTSATGSLSFQVPHTDLAGWTGPGGLSLDGIGWAYHVYVTAKLAGGKALTWSKTITLPAAQAGPVDFDLIPSGVSVSAPDGTPAVVLSVNGETGHVTVEGGTGGDGVTDWTEVTNKPATFPPSVHGHAIADVDGLDAALAAKADTAEVVLTVNGTPPDDAGNVAVDGGGGSVQDTGWRNISSFVTGGTSPAFRIRRVGPTVFLVGRVGALTVSGYGALLLTLPDGFRPGMSTVDPDHFWWENYGTFKTAWIETNGDFKLGNGPTLDAAASVRTTYATSQPWPATLPGTAL